MAELYVVIYRGVRTRGGKRNDLYDKSSREFDSSNAEEEDSVNQGFVTSDNSNLADDYSSEGHESNGNSRDNWLSAGTVIKVFQFNENDGMKINVPNDDNPLFFFNLFVIDQLLRNLVTRSDYLRRSS